MDKDRIVRNGDSARYPKKAAELRKEKRRRLILSDSDSDPDEPCEKKADVSQCQNRIRLIDTKDISAMRIEEEEGRVEGERRKKVDFEWIGNAESSPVGKDNGIRRMDEDDAEIQKKVKLEVDEEKKFVVLNNRILGSGAISKEADTKDMKVGQTRPEEKSARKPLATEVSLERTKTDSYKCKQVNRDIVYGKKRKIDSFMNHGIAKNINDEILGGSEVLAGNRKKVSGKQADSNSNHTNRTSAEIVKWRDRSDDLTLKKLKDKRNSIIPGKSISQEKIPEKSSMGTAIDKVKGNAPRVQGKPGVLKFLSKNKEDGVEIFHAKRGDEERTSISGSSSIARRNSSKQSSLSEDKSVHQKLVTGGSSDKNPAKVTVSLPAKDGLKQKAKCKVLSSRGNSKRLDTADSKYDMNDNSNCNSESSIFKKERINEGNEAASAGKQKLRDQIKNILLSAGWKIDLRPRRGKNYLDSVYIPPGGKGSYWSITKAYAVYQDQLNNAHTDQRSLSGMRSKKSSLSKNNNNFDVASSSSVIPTVSLDILRRVVVNKRRRKEDLEDAERNKIKKMKGSIKKTQALRKRKKSNGRFISKIDDTTISRVHRHLQTGQDKQKGYALLARGCNNEAKISNDNYIAYDGKRTLLAWMIDLGVVRENGKVRYVNNKIAKSNLEGVIKRDGIYCSCCCKTLTIEKFERHAGSKLQQASENIYVKDQGMSLLQCQLTAWEKQSETERRGFYTVHISDDDPNDDTCGICGDGGDLICCDSCPSTFHLSCLSIQMLPPGDWNCTNCSCKFCGAVSRTAAEETDITLPALLSCSQCEEKYHQNCVPETNSVSACSNSSRSFCGHGCKKIFKGLQKLLGVKNCLEEGFTWTLIRRFDDDLLRCKLPERVECNSKIAVAFKVMDECFEPIIDQRSGVNLIHNVVYNCGSNFNRLNYSGFYTFILERGDEIISAASVRIHGTKLAEMPFIGTRNTYRRQGMCRRLLDGIETALRSLNVGNLIIPAISELKDTWTTVFGFKPFEVSQELEVRSTNLLVFPGTGLLLKPMLEKGPGEPYTAADRVVGSIEGNIKQHDVSGLHGFSGCEAIHHTSNEVVLQLSHQHTGPNTPGSDGCISSECPSKVKTLECMPSEVADQPSTESHQHVVPCLEPAAELKGQVEQTAELLLQVKANDDHHMTSMNNTSLKLNTIQQQSARNSIVTSA